MGTDPLLFNVTMNPAECFGFCVAGKSPGHSSHLCSGLEKASGDDGEWQPLVRDGRGSGGALSYGVTTQGLMSSEGMAVWADPAWPWVYPIKCSFILAPSSPPLRTREL